ncbi:MAG TPA: adenosine deaminase [Trebonia sp.]
MSGWRASLAMLPKAELHVHLEGTLTAPVRARLAERHGIGDPLAGTDVVAGSSSFPAFARLYYAGSALLRNAADFADAVDSYLGEAYGFGVRHVEFALDVQTHHRRGVPAGAVVDGVEEGFARWHGRGVSGGMIATLDRGDVDGAPDALRRLRPYRDRVLGIGVASDERSSAPASFAPEFALAADWGWRRTAHAVAPDFIEAALDQLGVDRIDHGFRACERPDLVSRLVTEGIALAACPVTNVLVGPVESLRAHPLPGLIRRGVRASLSTDDPAYFGCGLADVYRAAADELGLRPAEVLGVALTSVDSSFATERRKSELRSGIDAWRELYMRGGTAAPSAR